MKLIPGRNAYSETIGGCRIAFLCRYLPSSQELVVFIHGLACDRGAFHHALDNERFASRSLLLVDLVGYGDSEKPEDFSYALEDQARVLDALLAGLPQPHLHLVAHSMGGAIGVLLSTATYERVRSFSNVEGNLIGDDCGILSRGVSARPLEEYRRRGYRKHLAAFKHHPMFRFEKTTPIAVHRSAVSLVSWSDKGTLLTRFDRLACRKAYFHGEANTSLAVLGQLNVDRKFMVPDSGHGMMVENPDAFYAMLESFIDPA